MKGNSRNFAFGASYEQKVVNFLYKRGIPLENIEHNGSKYSNFTDEYDIDIPGLNLCIEVKGTQVGTFKFWKKSYSKCVNCYAFYFMEKDITLFLTKSEFLDVVGRTNLRANHTKILHLKDVDIYDKAMGLRDVYNV